MENYNKSRNFGFVFVILWILITIIYTYLSFLFLEKETTGSGVSSLGGHIAGFFGLFTPIGKISILFSFLPTFLVANIVGIISIFKFIKWGNKRNLAFFKSILYSLFFLFSLTIFLDLIRFMPFESFRIFLDGYMGAIQGLT